MGGAGATTYGYNAQGQRTVKQVIGGPLNGTERYVYGPGGVLLGVYDAAGAVIEETVYLDDLPVAVLKHGEKSAPGQPGAPSANQASTWSFPDGTHG